MVSYSTIMYGIFIWCLTLYVIIYAVLKFGIMANLKKSNVTNTRRVGGITKLLDASYAELVPKNVP